MMNIFHSIIGVLLLNIKWDVADIITMSSVRQNHSSKKNDKSWAKRMINLERYVDEWLVLSKTKLNDKRTL